MKLATALLATLALVLPGVAAASVAIDFDVDTNGNPVPHGTVVNTLYAPWGATFSHVGTGSCGTATDVFASSNCLTSGPISAPNVVTLCDDQTCSDLNGPAHGYVRADFASAADQVCINGMSVEPAQVLVMTAFDVNNVAIGQVFGSGAGTVTMCLALPGIRAVEFSGHATGYGWFDDLRVNFEIVGTQATTISRLKALYR